MTTHRCFMLSRLLILAFFLVLCHHAQGQNGLLVSYNNVLEVLDLESGHIQAKQDTNLNYISSIAITNLNTSQKNILAVDINDGKHSDLKFIQFDHGSKKASHKTLLQDLDLIDDVAYDASRNHAFLLSFKARKIVNFSLSDFTKTEISFEHNVKGLAVDSCRGDIYWSEWRPNGTVIIRNDGENQTVVAAGEMSMPRNFVIENRQLFWISRTSDGFDVQCLDLDTLKRDTICSHSNRSGPRISVYSMTMQNGNLFWSDWHNAAIWKVGTESTKCQPQVFKQLGSVRPMGIAILKSPLQSCEGLPTATPRMTTKTATTKSAPAVPFEQLYPQDCTNYCIKHELEITDFVENEPNVQLDARCFETSMGIPICQCQSGFSGSRCQDDPCQNYCLNDGKCLRYVEPNQTPLCLCQPTFGGSRCQANLEAVAAASIAATDDDNDDNTLYFHLFLTAVIFAGVMAFFIMVVLIDNRRLRLKLSSQPDVVRKSSRARVFSTSRSRSRGKKTSPSTSCSTLNQTHCNGDATTTQDGVVLDLEDCCQMTLCDTPCVEASIRRPTTHRKNRLSRNSVSAIEDGDSIFDDDTKNLI